MKRFLTAALAAFFISTLANPAIATQELRQLGCKGALNNGDLMFGSAASYTSSGYWDSGEGRRVYYCNASHIPFSSDNTIVLDDLYPLAAGNTWRTFYTDGSGVLTPLAIGASGYVLTSNGASSAPSWEVAAGGGTIESTSSVLKGDGSGNAVAALEGTDFLGVTGTAAKATELATDPSACSGGQFVNDMDADGTLSCGSPSGSGDMLQSVYDTNTDNVVDTCAAFDAQYIDWDQTTGPTSIANRPTLGDLALYDAGTLTDTYLCTWTTASGLVCNTAPTTYQPLDAELTSLSSIGNDKVISTDGSGNIETVTKGASGLCFKSQGTGSPPTWGTCGTGTPGGSDTQVQFNDSGSFGGDAGFTYNKTLDTLTIDNTVIADAFATTASDGEYYFNVGNTNNYTPTTEGDTWRNNTRDAYLDYDGSNSYVLAQKIKYIRFAVDQPTSSIIPYLGPFYNAITITKLECIIDPEGTGESITVALYECDSTADNCADGGISVTAVNASWTSDTSFTDAAFDANDSGKIVLGTPSGTVTSLSCTISYWES